MKNPLYIANRIDDGKKFYLPGDIVTETFVGLGKRGRGKTHAGSVIAEELLKRHHPVVIFDPMDVWFGLKSSKDGNSPGFPVVIFGGPHQDVPLEAHAGELIAETIIDRRIPAILSCKTMRKGERLHFMADFLETLYLKNKLPLHLICDEVHMIAPQMIRSQDKRGLDAGRCLGAMDDIILGGRNNGIGNTSLSQRPAMVNTNIRSQAETLIAFGMVSNHDIKAVKEWVESHADLEEAAGMLQRLPIMGKGEAWIWSPQLLNCFELVKFRDRETFDSSASPKIGRRARSPKKLAEVDIAALGEQIKAKVDEKRANDPQVLKSEIVRLRTELAKQKPVHAQTRVKTVRKIVRIPMPSKSALRLIAKLAERQGIYLQNINRGVQAADGLRRSVDSLLAKMVELHAQSKAVTFSDFTITNDDFKDDEAALARFADLNRAPAAQPRGTKELSGTISGHLRKNAFSSPLPENGSLGKGPTKLLKTIVGAIPREMTINEVGTLVGFTPITTKQYLGDLRKSGLIIMAGKFLKPTTEGIAKSGIIPSSMPSDPADVRKMWLEKLPQGPSKILDKLIEIYPHWIGTYEQLAQAVGYTLITTKQYCSTLRQNRLVDVNEDDGSMRASPNLFEAESPLKKYE